MSKFAHFEAVPPRDIYSIYGRHAEIARQFHQDALREFTGDDALTVDLVELNAVYPDQTTLEIMAGYDAISVSSSMGAGSIFWGNVGENIPLYKEFFEGDAPVYVVSAGNDGRDGEGVNHPRIADFSRNSLAVGEANFDEHGQPFIEEHSSLVQPTLAATSPFNTGAYQYFDPSPSLEGHEDLIKEWLVKKEFSRRLSERLKSEGFESATEYVDKHGRDKYYELREEVSQKFEDDNYKESQELQDQIQHYMDNPEELHEIIMGNIRRVFDGEVDENGYVAGIDGTSFSGPYMAGHISGALHEQGLREERGLPVLTKEEICSLAKMSTVDTLIRENQDTPLTPETNEAGFELTKAGGHGVFNPEMYRRLLDEAYARIESNPEINRDAVNVVVRGDISNNESGRGKAVSVRMGSSEEKELKEALDAAAQKTFGHEGIEKTIASSNPDLVVTPEGPNPELPDWAQKEGLQDWQIRSWINEVSSDNEVEIDLKGAFANADEKQQMRSLADEAAAKMAEGLNIQDQAFIQVLSDELYKRRQGEWFSGTNDYDVEDIRSALNAAAEERFGHGDIHETVRVFNGSFPAVEEKIQSTLVGNARFVNMDEGLTGNSTHFDHLSEDGRAWAVASQIADRLGIDDPDFIENLSEEILARQSNGFEHDAQAIVLDRIRMDVVFGSTGTVPYGANLKNSEGYDHDFRVKHVSGGDFIYESRWAMLENVFGQVIDGDVSWEFMMRDRSYASEHDTLVYQNVDMTIYGYEKDGLMHQMMEYAQSIQPEYEFEPAQGMDMADEVPKTPAPEDPSELQPQGAGMPTPT